MKVKVLDAIMGSGKTQRLIGDVAKITNPVIYITPLLSECHRFAGTVFTTTAFFAPKTDF